MCRTFQFSSIRWALLLIVSLSLAGCLTSKAPPAPATGTLSLSPTNAHDPSTNILAMQSLLAVLWYQRAAERDALCYQACNIARERLDRHLADRMPGASNRPSAIIVDIDETVLDNSPYQAGLALRGETYQELTFSNWVSAAKAKALPGISNLLHYATNHQVEIFYISNRKFALEHDAPRTTITNLINEGLPCADEKHVLLQTTSSSKDDRRGPLLTNGVYDIVFLMGDNLADFHHEFEGTNANHHVERRRLTKSAQALFGDKYIVMPNPMYGDWENALYDKKSRLLDKVNLRNEFLDAYNPTNRTVTLGK